MFIELEPVFNNEGFSLPVEYTAVFSGEDEGELLSTVRAAVGGRVYNSAGVVNIDAAAAFELRTACDRCAEPIALDISVPIRHVLVTKLNDEEKNDELILIEAYRFDLDALVREDIYLSLPSKFLCSEDCRGICPGCGKNLNTESCSCERAADPRLEVLRQLLDK